MFQIPLYAHIEHAVDFVDILVEIQNIAAIGGNKFCNHSYYAGSIRTVHYKHSGVGSVGFVGCHFAI